MKVEQVTNNKKTIGKIQFRVIDSNPAVVNGFRQIAIRDVPIYKLEVTKMIVNDSEYQDEILANEIGKLKINQVELSDKNKKFTLKVSGFNDEYRPVYADDISGTEGFWEYDRILLCTLKKGKSLHIELKLVQGTKRETGDTGFLSISKIGHPDEKDSTLFSGLLLGSLTFQEITKAVIEKMIEDLTSFVSEMKKVKEESVYGQGYTFKTAVYDYVILSMINSEIHDLFPDIGFCAYNKPFSSFPETTFVIWDKNGKEMEIMKTAADSILKRIKK